MWHCPTIDYISQRFALKCRCLSYYDLFDRGYQAICLRYFMWWCCRKGSMSDDAWSVWGGNRNHEHDFVVDVYPHDVQPGDAGKVQEGDTPGGQRLVSVMGSANEWRRYVVTSSLIGWAHTNSCYCSIFSRPMFTLNILRPRQNGRHVTDDIFKCILLNENVWLLNKISLKFVPKDPINNISSLVQIMAWRRPGDKPLSEPMMVSSLTHICVTRPQ